jgi:integrase
MIADVLNVYGQEVVPHKKTARNIAYCLGSLLRWWGDKNASEISAKACREYAKTKASSGAAQDLKILRAAIGHWHKEHGPLNFMPSFWRPEEPPARERYLTRDEVAKLLWAARRDQHIKRLILLGIYTGSRPGVILSLEWSQIDLNAGVLKRAKLGAVQSSNKKAPNVRLGRRIMAHLGRWKRIDGDNKFICHFMGRPTDDPHGSWRRIVKASGLPGKVTRHTLRHTRATWMAQAGVPLFEAAGFLGMTVKTLEKTYAHHDPKHQEHAANI